jgi:DNA-binding transcriptional ArsR family regulator
MQVVEKTLTEPEQQVPEHPFRGVLGDTSELRIIEQLMSSSSDFNISELARVTQVSRPTVHKAVRKLLESGVLEVHSTRGNMKFYGLNEEWSIGNVLTKVKGKRSAPDNEGEELIRRIQSPVYDREG